MKTYFLCFLLFLFKVSLSQSPYHDSLQYANLELDTLGLNLAKGYEAQGWDFLILRVKDTIAIDKNLCSVTLRKDSCSSRFELRLNRDYSISHVTISSIDYYGEGSPCHDDLIIIENYLLFEGGVLTEKRSDSLYFENTAYTLLGRINGKYITEFINKDELLKLNSSFLPHIICDYMRGRC